MTGSTKGRERGQSKTRSAAPGRNGTSSTPLSSSRSAQRLASLLNDPEVMTARVPAPRRPADNEPILSEVVQVRDVWRRSGKYGGTVEATIMALPKTVREVTGINSGTKVVIRAYANGFTVEPAPGILNRREDQGL